MVWFSTARKNFQKCFFKLEKLKFLNSMPLEFFKGRGLHFSKFCVFLGTFSSFNHFKTSVN